LKLVKDKKNTAHEAEKKKEKEDWEKKMGILTYLGQSATEPHGMIIIQIFLNGLLIIFLK